MPEFGIQSSKLLQWGYTLLTGNKYQGQYSKRRWTQCWIYSETGSSVPRSDSHSRWLVEHLNTRELCWGEGIPHSFSVQGMLMVTGTAISVTGFRTKAFFLTAEAIWSAWCLLQVRECNPLMHSFRFPYSLYNAKGQNTEVQDVPFERLKREMKTFIRLQSDSHFHLSLKKKKSKILQCLTSTSWEIMLV